MAASQPALESNTVALFDDLGLLVHDCDTSDPADEIIFKLLEMQTLLASVFELEGFKRGVAVNPHAQNLAVECSAEMHIKGNQPSRRHYVGFKTN